MRFPVGLAALAAAALLAPAAAQASNVCTSQSPYCFDSLSYRAQEGETNNVTVSNTATTYTVTDSGANISQTQGSGCTISDDLHTATCPRPGTTTDSPRGPERFDIALGDGNDTLTNNLAGDTELNFFRVFISLAAGNDTVTGSDSTFTGDFVVGGTGDDTASLRGGDDNYDDEDFNEDVPDGQFPMGGTNTVDLGAGDDFATGGPGVDTINGGPGDDGLSGDEFDVTNTNSNDFRGSRALVVSAATGNDVLDGGDGFDSVSYSLPPSFDANGKFIQPTATTPGAKIALPEPGATTTGNGIGSESDTLKSIEDTNGTPGADTITGSSVSNVIFAGAGNDALNGAGGPDTLNGGNDDDTIDAADGVADRVNCGGQAGDKANIDQFDTASGCPASGAGTTVTQVTNTPPVDKSPPVLVNIRAPKSIKASKLKKSGYKFSLESKDTTADRLLATLTAKVGKLAITSTAGEVIMAESRKTFTGKVSMTLKISKKLKKAIKKKKKLRLLIQVTDQAGNTTPKRVVIKIT